MRFPLQSRIPRRQGFLLLLAILVPCVVLVALGWRMMEYERELEIKQTATERLQQLDRIRQELLSLLEKIKLREWSRLVSSSERPESAHYFQENAAFVGVLDEGQLRLPWEDNPEAQKFRESLNEPDFSAAIRKAEVEELVTHQYASAVVNYEAAIKAAHDPPQQAYARLSLARSLKKANRGRESLAEYKRVFALPLELVDEYGIPLALYAAPPLIESGVDQTEMLAWIPLVVDREKRLPLDALYLTRDLARNLQASVVEDRLAQAIGEHEWAQKLQGDSSMRQREDWGERTWIPYGEAPWLVAVTPPLSTQKRLMVAVHADQILARLATVQPIRVARATDPEGELLGEGFPGVSLVVPALAPQGTSLRQTLLAFAVILALAFALLAGYLVHRDVQRNLRLAELRSQFVSSVTHELKTPLTAIRMFSETLRLDEEVDRKTHGEYLDTILHESERLSRLVDNVLDFGSIERGKKTYRFEPVRLDEVVEGAARTIQYPLEQAGFVLEVALERGLPPVAADSDALQQAILNLLTNAMKYSGESRQIRLVLDRKNGHARINVKDQGIGIPREEQGRIFDRFYRMTTAENQHIPGAGLGLTLVAHIAKAHGGGVDLDSSLGAGSTFTIRLPLPEGEAVERDRNNV